ncbi:unnamed protein product, partial [Owenia fusiformis]
IIMCMIVAVLIISTNLLTIVSIVKFKCLRKTSANKFILSLACADFLLGLALLSCSFRFYAPNLVNYFGNKNAEKISCLICIPCITLGALASLMNFLLVTLDRFVSISRPYLHTKWFSDGKIKIVIALIWSYTVICVVIMKIFYQYNEGDMCLWSVVYRRTFLLLTFHVFSVLTLSTLAYAYIFIIAWQQHKKIYIQHAMHRCQGNGTTCPSQRKDFKLTKMVAWVYAVLMICFIPFICTTIMLVYY